ncbi:MAG: xylulokinase [Hyphomicrobiaceae bacterium]|nr:xylulokinase [Hyphomicrobiaceae bacterium]MCC0024062.1 xylulokinase [Hyphomicrobiaceae bacterium]
MAHENAYYVGLDIGTSGVKAALMSGAGVLEADALAPLEVFRPKPGWSEQNPADWWAATQSALDQLAKAHPEKMARVRGLGLSGQMHGATLIDKDDKVLRPAILWNDGRSAAECAEIERDCPNSRQIAGNIAMPGFTAPKIAWVRTHEPDIYAQIAKVLLPKDYVRLCLSGDYVSDMSDAAGTLWLNVAERRWSPELLAATGLDESHMPRLVEGSEDSAILRDDLRQRWGMSEKVVIAGGGGDNAVPACGIGAIRPGEGFVSLGTSGVLFVTNDRFRPNTEGAVHAFCHAVPNTWHQMGVILSATDSLNWIASNLGQSSVDLANKVAESYQGPGEEIFLPYLSGERTPHNNAAARGSFVGLSHLSDPVRLAQAVMEGVAFAFRDCQRVLGDAGTSVNKLIAVGGGSNSRLWLEMIATLLDQEINILADGDFGGAFGAARLGLCAAEKADPFDVCTTPDIKTSVTPNSQWADALNANYQRYRALYGAIEETRR